MIDHEMDFGRVPDPWNAHFGEDLDGEWSSAILSHREIDWQYSNVSRAMDLLARVSPDANDLFREGQRIIVHDVLTQWRSEAGEKTGRY